MTDLLPVYRNRPSVVPSAGGRVFIAVHDAEFFRQRAVWKQKLAAAHPDADRGSAFRFRHIIKQRDRWQADEEKWYAQYGLSVPSLLVVPDDAPLSVLLAYLPKGRGAPPRTLTRAAAYLADHPMVTNRELANGLGVTRDYATVLRHRLKQVIPRPSTETNLRRMLTLLADRNAHTASECRALLGSGYAQYIRRLRVFGFDVRGEWLPGHERHSYRLVFAQGTP